MNMELNEYEILEKSTRRVRNNENNELEQKFKLLQTASLQQRKLLLTSIAVIAIFSVMTIYLGVIVHYDLLAGVNTDTGDGSGEVERIMEYVREYVDDLEIRFEWFILNNKI